MGVHCLPEVLQWAAQKTMQKSTVTACWHPKRGFIYLDSQAIYDKVTSDDQTQASVVTKKNRDVSRKATLKHVEDQS